MNSSRDMVTDSAREPKAFTMHPARSPAIPVLIAVPHAGRDYPSEVLAAMRDPAHAARRLEDRLVDAVAMEASRHVGVSLLIANTPRAVLDLNRSVDDVDWSMISGAPKGGQRNSLANRRARSGLGLVPRRLPGHGEIWRGPIAHKTLEQRVATIHKPYHHALGQELAKIRDVWGAALLIDLHSMPPLRPKRGQGGAPEFVVGDRFGASCEVGIASRSIEFLESNRRVVAHNRPYSGGFVLDAHAAPRRGIHALQLEICRSAYLDHHFEEANEHLPALGKLVASLAACLGRRVEELGSRGDFFAQAAE